MKLIPLVSRKPGFIGLFAQVDDDKFDVLNQWRWNIHVDHEGKQSQNIYVVRLIRPNSRIIKIRMHRVLMSLQDSLSGESLSSFFVDHIDHNGLNNQVLNLRVVTQSENQQNLRLQSNSTSGFQGVSFDKERGKYQAKIKINKKTIHIGRFNTAEEASLRYQEAKLQYHQFKSI